MTTKGDDLQRPVNDEPMASKFLMAICKALLIMEPLHPDSLPSVAVCERMLLGVTLVGLIIAIFGVAFMFGGHPVIATMLLLLAWLLMMLDEDMKSG